jgi:hypothetical protein
MGQRMTESEQAGFYAFAVAVFIVSILVAGVLLR